MLSHPIRPRKPPIPRRARSEDVLPRLGAAAESRRGADLPVMAASRSPEGLSEGLGREIGNLASWEAIGSPSQSRLSAVSRLASSRRRPGKRRRKLRAGVRCGTRESGVPPQPARYRTVAVGIPAAVAPRRKLVASPVRAGESSRHAAAHPGESRSPVSARRKQCRTTRFRSNAASTPKSPGDKPNATEAA